jgi:hypothetical protein
MRRTPWIRVVLASVLPATPLLFGPGCGSSTTCPTGFADCGDLSKGLSCQTDIMNDANNCGGCGQTCTDGCDFKDYGSPPHHECASFPGQPACKSGKCTAQAYCSTLGSNFTPTTCASGGLGTCTPGFGGLTFSVTYYADGGYTQAQAQQECSVTLHGTFQ